MSAWLAEVQTFLDALAGSVRFWMVGAVALLIAGCAVVSSLIPSGEVMEVSDDRPDREY